MSAPASSSRITAGGEAGDLVGRFHDAVRRLDALIDPSAPPPRGDRAQIQARAGRRLDRLRRFLRALGDPQDAAPIVHVAGTSGKGSTATTAAAILSAAGYRVGLHTSPYLQVATEKVQLDGSLLAPDRFADLAERTLIDADRWRRATGEERLGYAEIWFALVARCFAEAAVDVAVIEVGAGGRFDPSNVVRPAVAVITTVGLDHQVTLGETIEEIAWHKAGILKPGAIAVSGASDPLARAVIGAEAATLGVPLIEVAEGTAFAVSPADQLPTATVFRSINADGAAGPPITTAIPGRFQAANAAVALAAVRALAPLGFAATDDQARRAIRGARLPGRMEQMPVEGGPPVLLDGAHNPQKMAALSGALAAQVQHGGKDEPPVVLLGLLHGKDVEGVVRNVVTRANRLVVTRPRVLGKRAADPEVVAAAARAAGLRGPILIEPDPSAALDAALALAAPEGRSVLVTGSLYLVGQSRERWYPSPAILLQRTPWPSPQAKAADASPTDRSMGA